MVDRFDSNNKYGQTEMSWPLASNGENRKVFLLVNDAINGLRRVCIYFNKIIKCQQGVIQNI